MQFSGKTPSGLRYPLCFYEDFRRCTGYRQKRNHVLLFRMFLDNVKMHSP